MDKCVLSRHSLSACETAISNVGAKGSPGSSGNLHAAGRITAALGERANFHYLGSIPENCTRVRLRCGRRNRHVHTTHCRSPGLSDGNDAVPGGRQLLSASSTKVSLAEELVNNINLEQVSEELGSTISLAPAASQNQSQLPDSLRTEGYGFESSLSVADCKVAGAIIAQEELETVSRLAVEEHSEGQSLVEVKDRLVGEDAGGDLNSSDSAAGVVGAHTIWEQAKRICAFAGPALGIWLSNPAMGLIDTAIVGRGSSVELAAMGPGTVMCDSLAYVFMFLSIATSNLIATSLAKKDKAAASAHLGRLLFVASFCGCGMIAFTHLMGKQILSGFVGAGNTSLLPAAMSYVQIRSFAWPAVLVMNVAQSASLGMQDSWGPLKVLAFSSIINAGGDLILCNGLGQGIAGAAWATMASQWVGMLLMLKLLNDRRKIALRISVPSFTDLAVFANMAAPIMVTMLSKVLFYAFLTYLATSFGTVSLAAHQVAIGVFTFFAVWGEPLCQTAQSFMPQLLELPDRTQARTLVKSLITIGCTFGALVGGIGAMIILCLPGIFTKDPAVVAQARQLCIPLAISLSLTSPILSLEGTLLALRDFGFLSKTMLLSMCGCSFLLSLLQRQFKLGLLANWWCLVIFQIVRVSAAGLRVRSSSSLIDHRHVKPLQASYS